MMSNQAILARSDPEFVYVSIEDVEPLERYCYGGYHSVSIGDMVNGRYRIDHKLGFGANSTTWLAHDERRNSYVAVKILVAQHKKAGESLIMRHLNTVGDMSEAPPEIPRLLDEFRIEGPNGVHHCIVTTPARASISSAHECSYGHPFQTPVARAIAVQIIQAVAFVHSRGVVHGDLHLQNILLRFQERIDDLTKTQFYAKYSAPRSEPVERIDKGALGPGVPAQAIIPVWMGAPSDKITLPDARILLNDFSEAFMPSITERRYSSAPHHVRPPEAYFVRDDPLSFPADIWALGCTIFSILGYRPLFDTWFPSDDRMIAEHIEALGNLPDDWWNIWEGREDGDVNKNGQRKDGERRRTLERRFEYSIEEPRRDYDMEEIGAEEKRALLLLLSQMLVFHPKDRPTANDVLESEWVKKWALGDLQKMQQM